MYSDGGDAVADGYSDTGDGLLVVMMLLLLLMLLMILLTDLDW